MTHHIFYDPSLFPSLTTLLTHSLNKLSTTHTLTYTLVPNIQSLIHKNENRGEVSVAIIVCMPREYGTYKALIERNDSPRFRPRILSPMWIISSALSCRLQPMVGTSLLHYYTTTALLHYCTTEYLHEYIIALHVCYIIYMSCTHTAMYMYMFTS
jgi:hypothetical protein